MPPAPVEPAPVEPVEPRWRGLLLVCRKCGRKRSREAAPELRRALRRALKDRGLARSVRVVESGCLDICPKTGLTVAAAPPPSIGTDPSPRCVVAEGPEAADAALDALLDPQG